MFRVPIETITKGSPLRQKGKIKERTVVTMQYGLRFFVKGGVLFIRLPSGRNLAYVSPRLETDERFNKEMLSYEGTEQGTKHWARIKTYGPKIVENIVQGIARDCLAEAVLRLDEAGYKIAFHVHDEVVLDVPDGFGSVKEVEEIMSRPIGWAPGLPLRAEAFETEFYKKRVGGQISSKLRRLIK